MIKKNFAYSLLIAFAVLLTPRTFWHDCEDHHDHHDGISNHFEKKCYACDYDMNAAEEPVYFSPCFFAAFYPKLKEVKVEVRAIECVRTQLLRGPPIV